MIISKQNKLLFIKTLLRTSSAVTIKGNRILKIK